MGKGRITDYIVSHLAGRQPLAWSFFVNGVALYVLIAAAPLILSWGFSKFGMDVNNGMFIGTFIILFLCCMTWSLVGNTAAAVRTFMLRRGSWQSLFAIIILGIVLVVTVGIIDDLFHLLVAEHRPM